MERAHLGKEGIDMRIKLKQTLELQDERTGLDSSSSG
jgi:hypothetical protein